QRRSGPEPRPPARREHDQQLAHARAEAASGRDPMVRGVAGVVGGLSPVVGGVGVTGTGIRDSGLGIRKTGVFRTLADGVRRDDLSAFIDDAERPAAIVATASVYIVLWIFLAGGIIDRYARERPTHGHGFFAACGMYVFRLLRLALAQWLVYALLFAYMHSWL